MYTLLELKDKRGLLIDENIALTQKAEKETRKLTEDEQKSFDERRVTIESLEKAINIEEEKRKVDPNMIVKDQPVEQRKRLSLIGAINAVVNKQDFDPDHKALFEEGRNEMIKAGVSASGNIVIPSETRTKLVIADQEKRAAVVSGQAHGTTAGGYAIGYDYKTVLPPLTDYLVLAQAGASYLTGLVGDVEIPTYSGTTVMWKGEVTTATDGAGTWGHVALSPKRLTAFVDVSKMFLLQDNVGADAMLRANITKAIACKLEATILGNAAGTTTYPAGLFYAHTLTSAATAASYSAVVALETAVNTSNALMGNLSYITNAAGKGLLKSTAKVSSSDSVMVCEGNEVNGYPVLVSNGVASGTDFTTSGYGIIFGNWSDLLIGQWGGYDLTVDPYTQAALGTVRLVVNCYFDAAIARSASFEAAKLT